MERSTNPYHPPLCRTTCEHCSSATTSTSQCNETVHRIQWKCCSSAVSSISCSKIGHLPASLTVLVFGNFYTQPLLPGVLPAGLQRLRFASWKYLQSAATARCVATTTQGSEFQLDVLTALVRHSLHLRQPLWLSNATAATRSIPDGVVHLNLGHAFNHPLLPGVLPSSLRTLYRSTLRSTTAARQSA